MEALKFFDRLRELGGFYSCPRDPRTGKRLGPLVGCAARDKQGRQLVSPEYCDCSVLLGSLRDLRSLAIDLRGLLIERGGTHHALWTIDTVVGVPRGGVPIGLMLAEDLWDHAVDFIWPDKRPKGRARQGSRAKHEFIFNGNAPPAGRRVLLVEDVGSTFASVKKLIKLIERGGAQVVGVACILNRSSRYEDVLVLNRERQLPIIAAVRHRLPVYTQDHDEVSDDVRAGKLILEPRRHRAELQRIMSAHAG